MLRKPIPVRPKRGSRLSINIQQQIISALETNAEDKIDHLLSAYSADQKKAIIIDVAKQLYADENHEKANRLVVKYNIDSSEVVDAYLMRDESLTTVASMISEGQESVAALRGGKRVSAKSLQPQDTAKLYAKSKNITGVNEIVAKYPQPAVIEGALNGYLEVNAFEHKPDAQMIFVMTTNQDLRAKIAAKAKFSPEEVSSLSRIHKIRIDQSVSYKRASAIEKVMREYVFDEARNLRLNQRQAYALTKPGAFEWLLQIGPQFVRGKIDEVTPRSSSGRLTPRGSSTQAVSKALKSELPARAVTPPVLPVMAEVPERESSPRSVTPLSGRRSGMLRQLSSASAGRLLSKVTGRSSPRSATPEPQVSVRVVAPDLCDSASRNSTPQPPARPNTPEVSGLRTSGGRASLLARSSLLHTSGGTGQSVSAVSSESAASFDSVSNGSAKRPQDIPGEIFIMLTALYLEISEKDAHVVFAAVNLRFYNLMLAHIIETMPKGEERNIAVEEAGKRYRARISFYKTIEERSDLAELAEKTQRSAAAEAGDESAQFKFKANLSFHPKCSGQ